MREFIYVCDFCGEKATTRRETAPDDWFRIKVEFYGPAVKKGLAGIWALACRECSREVTAYEVQASQDFFKRIFTWAKRELL